MIEVFFADEDHVTDSFVSAAASKLKGGLKHGQEYYECSAKVEKLNLLYKCKNKLGLCMTHNALSEEICLIQLSLLNI